jgi:release factor glutamine methyltransferase
VQSAHKFLRPGGLLAIEVGAGQAAAVETLFLEAGFKAVRRAFDYARIERVVSGVVE